MCDATNFSFVAVGDNYWRFGFKLAGEELKMRRYLKLAYQKGEDSGIRNNVPEHEVGPVKEALGWEKAAISLGGIGKAVGRVARIGEAALPGGRVAQNIAARLGRRAAESSYAKQLMLSQLGLVGAGAGVGALAGGEGNRGRGALIGALTGLGLGAGARLGGLKSLGKGIRAFGGQAARQVQAGTLARNQVGAFIRKQLLQSPYKHRFARQLAGAGILGSAGAAGAGMVANALAPKRPLAGVSNYSSYGQVLGVSPQFMGRY